jgi:hypothetical protein
VKEIFTVRTLLHIPIMHTQADMGALREPIRQLTIEKLGQEGWERKVKTADQRWEAIRQVIEKWELPYEQVRLYQDGLPNCGREVEIVTQLAQAGSPNHTLLVKLMQKGATLMGTESPDLLLQEYQLIQQTLARREGGRASGLEGGLARLSRSLLEKRDRYIAARISKTLGRGETGIIFLGLLHSLERLVVPDIRLQYPLGRPAPRGKAGAS